MNMKELNYSICKFISSQDEKNYVKLQQYER